MYLHNSCIQPHYFLYVNPHSLKHWKDIKKKNSHNSKEPGFGEKPIKQLKFFIRKLV